MENEKSNSLDSEKRKNKLEKYDARGVQTLFRTLSKNHYNLLKMVDNKARIILTVNSIISSLLLGVLFVKPGKKGFEIGLGIQILVVCSMLSMVFAIFSMLPHKYFGRDFKKSGYKGTLYAVNFTSQSLQEFKEEFDRIMEKGQNIYDEMIDDIYFLGKIIARKQRLLLLSTAVFIIGLISTIIYSLVTGVVAFS